jgi:hypothetical protein
MALEHLDFPSGSQGLYGTDKTLLTNGVYAQYGDSNSFFLVEDPDPNVSGAVARIDAQAGATCILRYILSSSQTKVGLGRRMWQDNLPTDPSRLPFLFEWRNGSNSVLGSVSCDTTGRLIITVGASVTTTTVPWLVANTWQHLEAVMDTTAGTVEVRVEGIVALQVTGLTITGPIAQIAYRNPGVNQNNLKQYIKDLFIWNGSGSTNNTWMGPIQVFDLTPNADVSSGWTSTGANAFGVIDETPPNDADYIQADDTLPAPAIVNVTNLPANIVAVRGLVTYTRALKTDGGDATLVTGLSPNGTNWDNGADIPVSTAAAYWRRISEVSPATAAPWTPIEINALQFRFNRTV